MPKKSQKNYTFTVGRRKTAVARVRLYSGRGETVVNSQPLGSYFAGVSPEVIWQEPFAVTKTVNKYWATIKVAGGGKKSQLDAVRLGLARALVVVDADAYKTVLRNKGLLTRDARARERRKVGTGGKARRKKQSPKR